MKKATMICGYPGDQTQVRVRGDLIAVDYGVQFALENKLPIKYAIGDFDTLPPQSYQQLNKSATKVQKLAKAKDQTDTEAALELLLQQYQEVHIYHAFGGRLDHTIANLKCFAKYQAKGLNIYLHGTNYCGRYYLPGCYQLYATDYVLPYYSFFAFSDINNWSLQGMKYNVQQRRLNCFETYAISNEIVAEYAQLSFDQGVLLFLNTKDQDIC